MKKIVLYIDTASNTEIEVGLEVDGKKDIVRRELDRQKAQVVLPIVDQLLTKHDLESKDLTEIQVNPGPGSFVGLRVGVSIANTLGTTLKIPINGGKVGEIVTPIYS